MIKKKHTSFSYLAEIHYLYPHITIPESTVKKIEDREGILNDIE